MSERACHGCPPPYDLTCSERGVAVHLTDNFFEIAKRNLPDRVLQLSKRFRREQLVALVDRLVVVTHGALGKQLRLAVVRIPAGTLDPAPHHEIAPRHQVGVMPGRTRNYRKNLVANFRCAALVRIQAEYPAMPAFRDGAVAQIPESSKWDLNHAGTKTLGYLPGSIVAS